jgi:hypothetical protein
MATAAKKPANDAPEDPNLVIWNALCRTDPKHTKPFKRSGGFTGTAIKPIWIVHMLTEQFGPVGVGWGMGRPQFELVHASEGEVAVYCTVECWHGKPTNVFYGVGGDKAVGKNKYGLNVDDEAFKKAFTDAVNNAFKFVGVGADVHMGQFDDNKYVAAVAKEFANDAPRTGENDPRPDEPAPREKLEGKHSSKTALATALRAYGFKVGLAATVRELEAVVEEYAEDLKQAETYLPKWLAGDPEKDSLGLTRLTQGRRLFLEFVDRMRENRSPKALSAWLGAYSDEIEALNDAEGRDFQKYLDEHEAGLKLVETVTAGA